VLRRLDLTTHRTTAFAEGINAEHGFDHPLFAGFFPGDRPAISVMRDSADLYQVEVPEK
jgi:hypothetical protein